MKREMMRMFFMLRVADLLNENSEHVDGTQDRRRKKKKSAKRKKSQD